MPQNNLVELINALRQEEQKHRFSSAILIFNDTEAYKAILAIGKNALPMLLQELKKSPAFWLLQILHDITGVNLVNDKNRGKIYVMAQAWLDWAKCQNQSN